LHGTKIQQKVYSHQCNVLTAAQSCQHTDLYQVLVYLLLATTRLAPIPREVIGFDILHYHKLQK